MKYYFYMLSSLIAIILLLLAFTFVISASSGVGLLYLAAYLSILVAILSVIGFLIYIVKLTMLRKELSISYNKLQPKERLIFTIYIFFAISLLITIATIVSSYNYLDESLVLYEFLVHLDRLGLWLFILMLYLQKSISNKYINIAFYSICIEIFLDVAVKSFHTYIENTIISQILYYLMTFMQFIPFVLIIIAFKYLSEDTTYKKHLNIVLILYTINYFSIDLLFRLLPYDTFDSNMFTITNMIYVIYLGVIFYFVKTVLNEVDKNKKIRKGSNLQNLFSLIKIAPIESAK